MGTQKKMIKLIVINGSAECGKDEFINYIKEYLEPKGIEVVNTSTIDPTKTALKVLGWDGETKNEETRKAMAYLKRISIKLFDGPFKYIVGEIELNSLTLNKNFFCFVHCREPEEIEKLVNYYKKTCVTLLIRGKRGKAFKNGSDDVVENYNYDVVIENNKTLDDLKNEAIHFANSYLIGSI